MCEKSYWAILCNINDDMIYVDLTKLYFTQLIDFPMRL